MHFLQKICEKLSILKGELTEIENNFHTFNIIEKKAKIFLNHFLIKSVKVQYLVNKVRHNDDTVPENICIWLTINYCYLLQKESYPTSAVLQQLGLLV